ncbi:unnamed protein product, partial [Taenia asiatica]|uniref:BTB domain-containing protein n=1 Tax=Taenia asiatica TaxID=60517 RepID=A0A0R3W1B4_TAEAS
SLNAHCIYVYSFIPTLLVLTVKSVAAIFYYNSLVKYSDDNVDFNPRRRFRVFREQGKLIDLRITRQMETVTHLDENADFIPIRKFRVLREQGKLIDLRITTKDGECVEAHQLVLVAKFPLMLRILTSKEDEMATQWKQFPTDIVEAIINYAYTGRLIISTGNAVQLCQLAYILGSEKIVSCSQCTKSGDEVKQEGGQADDLACLQMSAIEQADCVSLHALTLKVV